MQQDIVVNTTTAGVQGAPIIAKLASGGWVAIWLTDSSPGAARGQIFDASGAKVGDGFAVNDDDFNGDGRSDVLWRHDSGAVYEWAANSNGSFTGNDVSYASVSTDWHVV